MTTIWAGLATGAIYALVAVGYNIVFTASGTFNFAHAQLMMLGIFLAYAGFVTFRLPLVVVILAAAVVVAAIAGIEERVAIRPIRLSDGHLVTTVGMASLLDGISQLTWGNQALKVPFFGPDGVWTVAGGRVLPVELLLIVVAIAVTLSLLVVARRTMLGLGLLAIAEDREAAMLRGINVRRLALGAFAFSGLLAGALGPIVGPKTFAVATLGSAFALKGFVALAMGGFGSLPGGLIGGFAVGLIEALSSRWLGSAYADLTVFAVLLVILLVRPTGLFGRLRERVV
jgi:branched-chain amino acid transport system permease protein